MADIPYVARWRADDGCHTVIALPERKRIRVLVQGYPMVLRSLPKSEGRYLVDLGYPLRRAARKMRAFARNNAGAGVRRFLDRVLA